MAPNAVWDVQCNTNLCNLNQGNSKKKRCNNQSETLLIFHPPPVQPISTLGLTASHHTLLHPSFLNDNTRNRRHHFSDDYRIRLRKPSSTNRASLQAKGCSGVTRLRLNPSSSP